MLREQNLLILPKFQKERLWAALQAPHLLLVLQEVLGQPPLLSAEAIRVPQLQGGVLLGLPPHRVALSPREARHVGERLQEQDVHKRLEGSHGAAVQLLQPRATRRGSRQTTGRPESLSPRLDSEVWMLSVLMTARATLNTLSKELGVTPLSLNELVRIFRIEECGPILLT